MNEIKNSVSRARDWRYRLDRSVLVKISSIQWYLSMGLWETLGWTDESTRYHTFGWYVTGKSGLDE